MKDRVDVYSTEAFNIKLAIFHFGFFYSGGGERTVLTEAKILKQRGYDVTCFAPSIRRGTVFPDLMKEVAVKSYFMDLPFPFVRESLNMITQSILAVPLSSWRFQNVDTIICHSQPAPWIAFNVHKKLGTPYICYLQQPTRFLYQRQIDLQVGWSYDANMKILDILVSGLGLSPIRKLDYISITNADAVLTNSRWIANWVKQIYGIKAIPCPLGIDPNTFKPLADNENILYEKYHITKPFILTTCRNVPQKRIDWLIQIMKIILEEYPDVRLAIAGRRTSHTLDLMKLSKKLGIEDKISFIGEVHGKDLTLLYSEAAVYAFPPPQEDFGLGPIEAMACMTPVVAWDYAGPKETIVNGVTGYKAKPYDLTDFAEKILKILENPDLRAKLGKSAIAHVLKKFTWEKHTDTLIRILRRLTN